MALGTGSVLAAASASLLAVSASAVSEGELQSTATFIAQRTIEQWRTSRASPDAAAQMLDRWGEPVETGGLFVVEWEGRPVGAAQWHVTVRVSSARLSLPVVLAARVVRGAP